MLTIQELEALRGLVQINVNINLPKGHHMAYDQVRLPLSWKPLSITPNDVAPGLGLQAVLPDSMTDLFIEIGQSCQTVALYKYDGLKTLKTIGLLSVVGAVAITPIVDSISVLESVDLSSIATFSQNITLEANPVLTTVVFGFSQLAGYLNVSGCALPAAQVNAIFARLVAATTDGATPWGSGGEECNVSGDNMEDPTGQGLIDKATLVGRGATIYDHSNPP